MMWVMFSPRYQRLGVCSALAILAACSTTVAGQQVLPADSGATSFPDGAPQQSLIDAAPQVRPCTEGDAQAIGPDDQECYLLFNTPTTWQAAQAACLAVGATLAVVTDQAEQGVVAGLSSKFPAGAPDLWLGATDEVVENSFVWVDGTPVVFQSWRTGEPNNGNGGGAENCSVIEGDTAEHGWDDRPCTAAAPYICERAP